MQTGEGWTRNDGAQRYTKINPGAIADEQVVLILSGGNYISLMIPSGLQPPAPVPQISASVSGKICTGATISVSLINNAGWNNVSISGATSSSWTRHDDGTNRYTKTDATATTDEILTIGLASGNNVVLAIPSGYSPNPAISATIDGNLIIGAKITVNLYNGANWNNVNITGLYAGSWIKNPSD